MARPVFNDMVQYYIESLLDGEQDEKFRVTEDTAFDPSSDDSSYDPEYKDRVVQPSYTTSTKNSIEFNIDAVDGQALQEWLLKHEDDKNVPVRITRVLMYRPKGAAKAQAWKASTAYKVGDLVKVGGKILEATKAGTSGNSEPATTGSAITDGTVTWKVSQTASGKEYEAKQAEYTMNQNQLGGDAGSAAQHTGTFSMTSPVYIKGSFDIEKLEFTPAE